MMAPGKPDRPYLHRHSRESGGVMINTFGLLPHLVIPAKAGIHGRPKKWIPAFAGMTFFSYT
jgi:hypothetical protein